MMSARVTAKPVNAGTSSNGIASCGFVSANIPFEYLDAVLKTACITIAVTTAKRAQGSWHTS